MPSLVEYIWMDGASPTQKLRSKTRIVNLPPKDELKITSFPKWDFDGSSTFQSNTADSDLILKPVNFVSDPCRGKNDYLLMCEVFTADDQSHSTNTRAELRRVLDKGAKKEEPWFGFEQEYTFFKNNTPLGWPDKGYPAPQGPFYCGVGADEVFGRQLVEAHAKACLKAGIMLYGVNAEVMPGQWEFQIGPRGIKGELCDPLNISDHAWLARWLLYRIGEDFNISTTLDPKPVKGNWNGAGQHTNFSIASMRNQKTGMQSIKKTIALLEKKHDEHIAVYGYGLSDRLTGLHETCSIDQFKHGISNRGASIRVPLQVANQGYGYLEDRRPGANADPYTIAARILKTICEIE